MSSRLVAEVGRGDEGGRAAPRESRRRALFDRKSDLQRPSSGTRLTHRCPPALVEARSRSRASLPAAR